MSDKLEQVLSKFEVNNKDFLFIHADLGAFGYKRSETGKIELKLSPKKLIELIKKINPQSTLIVPSFSYSWMEEEAYNKEMSPSRMGTLSEYIRKQPDAIRTEHPLMSLCAWGPKANVIAQKRHFASFDQSSPYQTLLKRNAYQLMLGTTVNSFNDFSQTIYPVPYRYKKYFFYAHGEGEREFCTHWVRVRALSNDLMTSVDAIKSIDPHHKIVEEKYEKGFLYGLDTQSFVKSIHFCLSQNPFFFQRDKKIPKEEIFSFCQLLKSWKEAGRQYFVVNSHKKEHWFWVESNDVYYLKTDSSQDPLMALYSSNFEEYQKKVEQCLKKVNIEFCHHEIDFMNSVLDWLEKNEY